MKPLDENQMEGKDSVHKNVEQPIVVMLNWPNIKNLDTITFNAIIRNHGKY